jgi:hypothetical protein
MYPSLHLAPSGIMVGHWVVGLRRDNHGATVLALAPPSRVGEEGRGRAGTIDPRANA